MNIDTIVAPATPPGHGGVGVIRISGSLAADIGKVLLKQLPKPRYAQLSNFYDIDDQLIDQGLALYFPAPHSFTGESILELQGHGGPVVMDRLLQHILGLGARMAQPGEFSQRAFLNGKLDLAQAEAIADLIEAASEQAASSAMRSLQGEFSKRIHTLVDALIQLRTYVEAAIDFPDEEINFLSDGRIAHQLEQLQQKLSLILSQAKQGALLREGMALVLVGKPNAGKSSLLNQLSGRDTAIVTAIAGTTRDVLREYIHIDGIPLHILDTAGLRDSRDDIEQEGVKRAWQAMQQADLILLIIDSQQIEQDWQQQYTDIFALNKPIIIVQNKIDLSNHSTHSDNYADQYPQIWLSAKTGEGIDHLKTQLKQAMGFDESIATDFIARTRHLQALQRAQYHLQQGQQQLLYYQAGELLAEELRQAQQAFNEITGEFTNEDLLSSIFSSFCIGK